MGRSATAAKATVSFVCRRTTMILYYARALAHLPRWASARAQVRVGPAGATRAIDRQVTQLGGDEEAGGAVVQRYHAGGVQVDGGGRRARQGGPRGRGIDGGDQGQPRQRRLGCRWDG